MVVSIQDLKERTESEFPGASTASMRDQEETLEFDIVDGAGNSRTLSPDDLNNLESLVLGSVSDDVSKTGALSRRLPLAHPIRKYFFASQRTVSLGVASATTIQVVQGILGGPGGDPAISQFPPGAAVIYGEYRIGVVFRPRLYPVLPDSFIPVQQGTWVNDAGQSVNFTYAAEWLRFCDPDFHPKDDWLSYTIGGQMAFKADAGHDPSTVNTQQYAQMPRVRLPNASLKITWYQVPYRYVTSPNSYLEKYKGRINQNAWWRWGAGSLLYMQYNPTRYQQPNPNVGTPYSILPPNPASQRMTYQAPYQTCDIELDFVLTNRSLQSGETATPNTPNNVVGGHNLLPWAADRKFHYAETLADSNGHNAGIPFWPSFPLEILFTDPDFNNPNV